MAEVEEVLVQRQKIDYKYNEDNILKELQEYIDKTYDEHYSHKNFQATEFVIDSGHGEGFCIGNIMKYAQRYGKKGNRSQARKDLMKILHYAIIQMRVHDLEVSSLSNKLTAEVTYDEPDYEMAP